MDALESSRVFCCDDALSVSGKVTEDSRTALAIRGSRPRHTLAATVCACALIWTPGNASSEHLTQWGGRLVASSVHGKDGSFSISCRTSNDMTNLWELYSLRTPLAM